MSTQGLSLAVISALQNKLQKGGSSEIDSALIRYFISGLLDIVQPPLSLPFVRSLSSFLLEGPCVDALLQSRHFEEGRRVRLRELVGNMFEECLKDGKQCLGVNLDDDAAFIEVVKSTYTFDV